MTDKIYIGIDSKRIEAKGEVLENLLQTQAELQNQAQKLEAEQKAKEAAKVSALAKLQKLGLTDDEISALVP